MTLSRETPKGSESVAAIQQLLLALGFFPGPVDKDFDDRTEQAVIRFQEFAGIYADGCIGPITMAAIENAYQHHVIELNSPGTAAAAGNLLPFVRVDADDFPGGNHCLFLRADAAHAYTLLKTRVNALGGVMTSSAGRRCLQAHNAYNRSATSFHYLGRALDLFFWCALRNPDSDPYVIQLEDADKRKLRVWARGAVDKVAVVTLDNILVSGDPLFTKKRTMTGPFFDLTAIMAEFDFFPIPYRRRFEKNGDALASEWWHFQFEKGLIPGASTFGGELLKVYPQDQLEGTPPWRYRDRVYKVNWR